MRLYHECKDCGKEAKPDTEKSNDNWSVVSTTCVYCGGKVGVNFDKSEL